MEMAGGHIGLSVHVNYIDIFLKQKDNYNIMTDLFPFKVYFTRADDWQLWLNTIPDPTMFKWFTGSLLFLVGCVFIFYGRISYKNKRKKYLMLRKRRGYAYWKYSIWEIFEEE